MKKNIGLAFVLMFVVLLTGCKKEVVTKCESINNQSASGYKTVSNYSIYSKDNKVKKVEITEEVTSKNNTVLAYFEKQYKNQYKNYKDTYGGYTYEVTNKDGKVTTKVTIDYTKVNFKKFIKDNPSMSNYTDKNGNYTLTGAKKMYESTGATCK